ncbi:PilZ domain-containing protein [Herbivorax sp. ANBcel31]|uniref:PilZ domain-containing protein n=1 Tax=Herbivorax sp. ANBcel31 TaxID=3069754 RepID=UPI0027B4A5E2|nr:PilZ domain-containing protein [Herbivorax sp. ANBcel31]MDQ2085725.1 PilZ domain-containing protein [Herbivorax sp. ANBcel31]
MNLIKSGDCITVRHYSSIKSYKSIVTDVYEDKIKIQLTKDFAVLDFSIGDPVVLGVEKDGEMYVIGCDIKEIDGKERILEVVIDKSEEEASQRRHERFPVSLYSDVRGEFGRKKHLGLIKDISYYGMLIYSKVDLEAGDEIEIDIYMDKKMIFLKGEIMRKMPNKNHIEYGIRVIYEDISAMNYMKDYLRKQKQKQIDSIKNSLT